MELTWLEVVPIKTGKKHTLSLVFSLFKSLCRDCCGIRAVGQNVCVFKKNNSNNPLLFFSPLIEQDNFKLCVLGFNINKSVFSQPYYGSL